MIRRAPSTELHIRHQQSQSLDQIVLARVFAGWMRNVGSEQDFSTHAADYRGIAESHHRAAVAVAQGAGVDGRCSECVERSTVGSDGLRLLEVGLKERSGSELSECFAREGQTGWFGSTVCHVWLQLTRRMSVILAAFSMDCLSPINQFLRESGRGLASLRLHPHSRHSKAQISKSCLGEIHPALVCDPDLRIVESLESLGAARLLFGRYMLRVWSNFAPWQAESSICTWCSPAVNIHQDLPK